MEDEEHSRFHPCTLPPGPPRHLYRLVYLPVYLWALSHCVPACAIKNRLRAIRATRIERGEGEKLVIVRGNLRGGGWLELLYSLCRVRRAVQRKAPSNGELILRDLQAKRKDLEQIL